MFSAALHLVLLLLAAKLGARVASKLRQPAVLGELLAGVLLGNLSWTGVTFLEPVKSNELVAGAAELGVLLLLFEVGLESTVAQMLEVGASSFLVASVGVIAPFALGWLASGWWHPHASTYVHVFLGATLTATSVGITARVLKDLDRSQTAEARVILGAAVIDDVMGLVILAVVIGALGAADRGGTLSYGTVAVTLLKALAFLVGSLVLGLRTAPRVFSLAAKLRAPGVLLVVGLAICFSLAWLASQLGLAPIVGAFAAGLILERVHYKDFTERGERGLEELVRPISGLLTPIFFVLMGMRTQLASFAQPGVLGLAAVLTVAAILGKQACGLGVLGRGVDRLTVGIGMIPRGEVGLIFANLGSALTLGGAAVVDHATYSAIVAMVIVTTLITPPALEWAFARKRTQPT